MNKYYSIFHLSWNFSSFGSGGESIKQIIATDGSPLRLANIESAELFLEELLKLPEWQRLEPRFIILPVYERIKPQPNQ
jgi:hypothetical protein